MRLVEKSARNEKGVRFEVTEKTKKWATERNMEEAGGKRKMWVQMLMD